MSNDATRCGLVALKVQMSINGHTGPKSQVEGSGNTSRKSRLTQLQLLLRELKKNWWHRRRPTLCTLKGSSQPALNKVELFVALLDNFDQVVRVANTWTRSANQKCQALSCHRECPHSWSQISDCSFKATAHEGSHATVTDDETLFEKGQSKQKVMDEWGEGNSSRWAAQVQGRAKALGRAQRGKETLWCFHNGKGRRRCKRIP